ITSCVIGEGSFIRQSMAAESYIGDREQFGQFAHIRPEVSVVNNVKICKTIEIKKTKIDDHIKITHLIYIGDTSIGSNVNMRCGTITVNYDGKNKYKTTIEDDAFIGCNANLIAPVTIGKGSYVAAGSTITNDTPEDSLAVARSRQTT